MLHVAGKWDRADNPRHGTTYCTGERTRPLYSVFDAAASQAH